MTNPLRNKELITRESSTTMSGQIDHLERKREKGKGETSFILMAIAIR